MPEQLKVPMGDDYAAQLVKMVMLAQITECYQFARDEQEELEKKRTA